MSKTQEIRDALAGGAMSFEDLHTKLGGNEKKLRYLISSMKAELTSMGRGAMRSIALASGKATAGARKGKGGGRKAAKNRGAAKRVKRLATKLSKASGAVDDAGREAKFAQHALTTFAALKAVLDINEDDVILVTAFRSHEQALELLAP